MKPHFGTIRPASDRDFPPLEAAEQAGNGPRTPLRRNVARDWARAAVAFGFQAAQVALAGSVLAVVGVVRAMAEVGGTWRWLTAHDEAPPTPAPAPNENKRVPTSCSHPSLPPQAEIARKGVQALTALRNQGPRVEQMGQPPDESCAMHVMTGLNETDEQFDARIREHYRQELRRKVESMGVFDHHRRNERGGLDLFETKSAARKNSAADFDRRASCK